MRLRAQGPEVFGDLVISDDGGALGLSERERIAAAGCAVVREHFTLERSWREILEHA